MTILRRLLPLVVLLELAGAAVLIGLRLARQPAPLPKLDRLDFLTATELKHRRAAMDAESAAEWHELGDGYVSSGFFAEAEFCFRRAREMGATSHELLLRWAISLDRLGRTSTAIEKYEKAAAVGNDRQAAVCRYHLARCYLRENKVDRGEEVLQQAGDFPLAQYLLAKIQVRSGRTADALPDLNRLLTAYPDALKLNQLRYEAETELGNAEEAAVYRERCERSRDRLFLDSTVEFLGLLRTRFGLSREQNRCLDMLRTSPSESGRAAECLRRTLQVRWDVSVAGELIRLELKLGRGAEAKELIEQRAERFGLSPEVAEQLGDALQLTGQDAEAARAWERALRLRPNAGLHQKLADYYSREEDAEQELFHRARAEHAMGVRLYRADDVDEAINRLQHAVEIDPDFAQSWYYLGKCRLVRGERGSAAQAYRRCLELNLNHGRAAAGMKRLGSD